MSFTAFIRISCRFMDKYSRLTIPFRSNLTTILHQFEDIAQYKKTQTTDYQYNKTNNGHSVTSVTVI